MTARLDTMVSAATPVRRALPSEAANTQQATEAQRLERIRAEAARAETHKALCARWTVIAAAGGVDAWVVAELKAKGLYTPPPGPDGVADKDKAGYKARKKAEAVERKALRKLAFAAYRATHIVHLGQEVHWDEREGPDARDRPERAAVLAQSGLAPIETPTALAEALGVTIPALRWFAFYRLVDAGTHYRRWQIAKRDGGSRTITAPRASLKKHQRWVLRNVAERLPVHGAAHGFLAGRSIVSNATAHAGAATVVKVDLKDFFPSIGWRRVKGLLRAAGYPERVATLLSLLCTEAPRDAVEFRGKTWWVASGPRGLPQGAPTSPAFTNALCRRLDRRLSGLARAYGFRYTRYADDLTFSWRTPSDPAAGAHPRAPVAALLRGVARVVRAEGFQMHPTKTRVMHASGPQMVTGLVVNTPPPGSPAVAARVPRKMRKQLRAALHNRAHPHEGRTPKGDESLAQLQGMAAFVYMTDPKAGRKLLDTVAALAAKSEG